MIPTPLIYSKRIIKFGSYSYLTDRTASFDSIILVKGFSSATHAELGSTIKMKTLLAMIWGIRIFL